MYRVIYLRMLKTCWVYRFKQNSEIKCFFSHCRRCSEKETPWKLLRLDSKFNFENMTSYKDVSLLPPIQASLKLKRAILRSTLSPSRGPLRFVTRHSRVALASVWKAKRLKRRQRKHACSIRIYGVHMYEACVQPPPPPRGENRFL